MIVRSTDQPIAAPGGGVSLRYADGRPFLVGYAALFNSPSVTLRHPLRGYEFVETILPGAFRRVLAERQDVPALWHHDISAAMAWSQRVPWLSLREDERGLRFIIPAFNHWATGEAIDRLKAGKPLGASFRFKAARDEWTVIRGSWHRTVVEIERLDEITVCNCPAYPETASIHFGEITADDDVALLCRGAA